MVVIGKKKYEAGEATQFMTRKQALKKLQLSLNEFRRLCIIKGIYPREPRNRKRAQKGDTRVKILYHKKDIQFLMHEPIIWKLRDYKIFARKVTRAKALRDFKEMRRYLRNHPTIKLDHIVKERYPTFIDALKDLDDCLTLCFLFSTFPSMAHIPRDQSILCRRLTVEFMHAVIAAKALRKVFISIKGYYYQAEIKGQTITWIVPHQFGFEPQKKNEVDFKIMSTFVEFYIIMLGFVNYRLYHSLNLFYPPKFSNTSISDKALVDEQAFVSERINALNVSLVSLNAAAQNEEDEVEIDTFDNETDAEKIAEAKAEYEKVKKLKTLFKGLKFYINREVPREALVFVIRCFGGEVSWDKLLFVGSTFDENDESITHQIVDRPSMEKQYISRYYVQPQWIFDSINARELVPVEKYLMGCTLPPHLSPFSDPRRDQTYIPPEERALMDPEYKMNYDAEEAISDSDEEKEGEDNEVVAADESKEDEEVDANMSEDDDDVDDEIDDDDEEEEVVVQKVKGKKAGKAKVDDPKEQERLAKKQAMKVKGGEIAKEDPWEKSRQERQEYRLREKLVRNKHRKLYKSMMKGREERAKDIWLLRKKRRLHEEADKKKKKEERKAKKSAVKA
ncbi:hypothetical protein TSAR_014005 [Trichomalopsis sarcophagae]|uniref:Pescadillo homolog n=1 Tax=Trichomalopsis sarcophagae TaxID=543379 RepID=A0A232F6M3_9HYME|nr:hypothetical protein TSAR_014005 [Trichomalopsis sarcophagae]